MALRKSAVAAYLVVLLVAGAACPGTADQPLRADDPILLYSVHMWQGHQYLDQGKPDLAAEAFLRAAREARWSPHPHFALARAYARRSAMDSLLELGVGLKLLAADFTGQSLALSNLLILLLVGVALATYVAVGVVLARHAKTMWFSVFLTFSPTLGEKQVRMMVAIAVAAVVLLISGLSPVGAATWLAVLGSGLAWRYATRSERRVMVGFVAFLILFVPVFEATVRLVSSQHPASPTKIAALGGVASEVELARIAEIRNLPPEKDPVGEFTRGLVELKRQEYQKAIVHFNTASLGSHSHAAVLNNVGLALHGLGRHADAKAKFEEALTVAPGQALIHYNYSQTLNSMLFFDLAQEQLSLASGLDFELTRSLVTGGEKPTLVPMGLDVGVFWALAADPANNLFKAAYHPVEAGWIGIAALAALTALAFTLVRRVRLPARCDVCGILIRTKVAKRKRRELLCRECKAIKQANADSNERLERGLEERVARLASRGTLMRIVLGLLVPGCAHHLVGWRLRGFLLSVAVFTTLALAVTGGGPVKSLPRFDLGGSSAPATVLFIVVYIIYAWRVVALALKASEGSRT